MEIVLGFERLAGAEEIIIVVLDKPHESYDEKTVMVGLHDALPTMATIAESVEVYWPRPARAIPFFPQ